MRLLVVTSQFPLSGDPQRGRPIAQTVRELAKLAEVSVVSPVAVYPRWARPSSYPFHAPDSSYQPLSGVTTRYVSYLALPKLTRAINGWSCARALARSVSDDHFDAVIGYWIYPDAYGAVLWARSRGLPVLCGARGSDLLLSDGLTHRQTCATVGMADRVLAVSRQLAEVACSRYGASTDRVAVIPNGCDTTLFRPGERSQARAALGIAVDTELIVYVGRLVFDKGLRELVEAAAGLRSARPHLQVVLVGEGPMRPELERLIGRSGAPVHLLGPQAPENVARWMCASNLVTLPSYSEGNPNVVLEAMASGRAVVAADVPGIAAVVAADTGLLVTPRSSVALRDGWVAALARPWDEAGIALRHARSWAMVAAETLAECRRAVAGRTPGP